MPQFGVRYLHDLIPASDLHPKHGYTVMTGPLGRHWACTIPTVPAEIVQDSIARSSKVMEQEDRENIQRGLTLIEPLSQACIRRTFDWWTYEFCYKSRIRQYHAIKVGGNWVPESSDSTFVLANYQSSSEEATVDDPTRVQLNGGSSSPGSKQHGTLQTTFLESHHDRVVLVQLWESGDICPETDLPRTVEVQYHCAQAFHDRIHSVTEPSICNYLMIVNVPALCRDPAFAIQLAPEVQEIKCRRIATESEIRQVEADASDAHVEENAAHTVSMEDQLRLLYSKDLGRPKHFRDVLEGIRHYAQAWEPRLTESQQQLLKRVEAHGGIIVGGGAGVQRNRKPKEVIEQERQERLQVAQMFRDSFGEQPVQHRTGRTRFDGAANLGQSGENGVGTGPSSSGGGRSRASISEMDLEELIELLESTEEELEERLKGNSRDKRKV
ncbi:protein OS-9 [Entomortierella parvispora]|uniref:Protein OS-9 homolog n=1 Tax=Entomortierella parvispora TaxID=205924 RepID=A0A9P3LW96_9FUNG|nr:protein OS-9 [Entomortierella parvispora]